MNAIHLARGSILGVIHLPPLPGAPRPGPGARACLDRALFDLQALIQGGARGCIVENLGDSPYAPGPAEPHVIAHMTAIGARIRHEAGPDWLLGINVLRNAPLAALGIASAVHADFVRVNVHAGAMVTDQGLIEGDARATLLYRRRLDIACAIAADVLVKHASPLGHADVAQVAHDTYHRGGADILIVSGTGTGRPADPERLAQVRNSVPDAPLWLGSGLNPSNAARYRACCDVAIVGTWLHEGSRLDAPLDTARIREVVESFAA